MDTRALCRRSWIKSALSASFWIFVPQTGAMAMSFLLCKASSPRCVCLAIGPQGRNDEFQLQWCWQVKLMGKSPWQRELQEEKNRSVRRSTHRGPSMSLASLSLICRAEPVAFLWARISPRSRRSTLNLALPCRVCYSGLSSPLAF